MQPYRLFIDETGDHRYRGLEQLDRRYLGLTGVLINKKYYDETIPQALESLKKKFFKYDPDRPPILVRSHIIYRKFAFGVLLNEELNRRWEAEIVQFYRDLRAQIFTVVIDKKVHKQSYPLRTFDAYVYALAVLLWRVRGFLRLQRSTADVMAESRGKTEDCSIQEAYEYLRENGYTDYGTSEGYSEAYPEAEIKFGTKKENIAGLQIADLIAYGQKVLTVVENERPYHKEMSSFTITLNEAIKSKVNRYGRYLLE